LSLINKINELHNSPQVVGNPEQEIMLSKAETKQSKVMRYVIPFDDVEFGDHTLPQKF